MVFVSTRTVSWLKKRQGRGQRRDRPLAVPVRPWCGRRVPGRRCWTPWVPELRRKDQSKALEPQIRGYGRSSNPKFRRRTTGSELNLRHLLPTRKGPVLPQRHIPNLLTSRRSSNQNYEGSSGCHRWDCCCWYLTIVSKFKPATFEKGHNCCLFTHLSPTLAY